MGEASGRVLKLRPVTFRFKEEFQSGDPGLQFGLIAEEVAEALPELVVYDGEGRPQRVDYRMLSPLLLNELQKQGRLIESQARELLAQRRENREQTRELQRLSASRGRARRAAPGGRRARGDRGAPSGYVIPSASRSRL